MTTLRQIEANRRNAQLSTGPVSEEGKRRSRRNAVRHGLTAETVIDGVEDPEDYVAFEMAVTAEYDVQSAVERELVLRLASLLWRLRRASAIESGLFAMKGQQLAQVGKCRQTHQECPNDIQDVTASENRISQSLSYERVKFVEPAHSFVRLCKLRTYPLDRLSRYEARLWRQARQIMLTLHHSNRRKRWTGRLP